MDCGVVYEQKKLEVLFVDKCFESSWQKIYYSQFITKLQKNLFPCLFGKKAYAAKQCKIVFVDYQQNKSSFNELYEAFTTYANFVKEIKIEERLLFPLIVFIHYNKTSLHQEHTIAWGLLQQLHDADPYEWPDDLPQNPTHPDWSFVFNGVPFFINVNLPSHLKIMSRRLTDGIVFIVNPRKNFDIVANLKETKGIKIRQTIRERIKSYNHGYLPAHFSLKINVHMQEWKQYQLYEPEEIEPAICPFISMRKLK